MQEKVKSGIFGLAVADAIGVPAEFESRDDLRRNPVLGMRGFGTHNQAAGTWSDDTSMTLALMDSLTNELDYHDIMVRFSRWKSHGEYTPHGKVFDIGIATSKALLKFDNGSECLGCGGVDEYDNGNGSLMRILPIAYYIIGQYGFSCETEVIAGITHNISSLTHGHIRSKIACVIYVLIAIQLLLDKDLKTAIHTGIDRAFDYYQEKHIDEIEKYQRIKEENFKELSLDSIKSSGYVVDTVEAAIWCLLNTNTYEECIISAVNLGEDTDTVAAVAGGLAGIAYGAKGIPIDWLNELAKRNYIEELCGNFAESIYRGNTRLLLPYKNFMATSTKKSCCKWEGGGKVGENAYAFAFPVYCDELRRFIRVAKTTCFWSYDYIRILESNSLELSDHLINSISSADVRLLGAILTAYIRQERFCDGLIASAVEDRVFYKIICKLEELYI